MLPNAGYQQELRGRMHYGDDPEYYAKQMERMIPLGINIAGGCCGTTPEHIAALKSTWWTGTSTKRGCRGKCGWRECK